MSDIQTQLSKRGYALVHCSSREALSAQEEIVQLLSASAEIQHVFLRHPIWKPLGVNPERPPGRSEGLGLNSLHIDCVSSQWPPRFVAMLCLRADPGQGGESLVSFVAGIWNALSDASVQTLRDLRIMGEPTFDLATVGDGLSEYRLDSPDDGFFRYSGRYLDDYNLTETERVALLELDRVLMARCDIIRLQSFDCLIIDQQQILHGRLPLRGTRPAAKSDRLLTQAFFRSI